MQKRSKSSFESNNEYDVANQPTGIDKCDGKNRKIENRFRGITADLQGANHIASRTTGGAGEDVVVGACQWRRTFGALAVEGVVVGGKKRRSGQTSQQNVTRLCFQDKSGKSITLSQSHQ